MASRKTKSKDPENETQKAVLEELREMNKHLRTLAEKPAAAPIIVNPQPSPPAIPYVYPYNVYPYPWWKPTIVCSTGSSPITIDDDPHYEVVG